MHEAVYKKLWKYRPIHLSH